MPQANLIDELAKVVKEAFRRAGMTAPRKSALAEVFSVLYYASLRTEEGKPIRCGITYASPAAIHEDAPVHVRNSRWQFHSFEIPFPFTVKSVVKLSRAVDYWVGSLVVYPDNEGDLRIWGVVDQMVHLNTHLNREPSTVFLQPGIFYSVIQGIGEITVYHDTVFIAALRANAIATHQVDAFSSRQIQKKLMPTVLAAWDEQPQTRLGGKERTKQRAWLMYHWFDTLSRLLVGIQRYRHGGAVLITGQPLSQFLNVGYAFNYPRLGPSVIKQTKTNAQVSKLFDEVYKGESTSISLSTFRKYDALKDVRDDIKVGTTGAVRLVASLASVDGLVLMSPLLEVKGFGVKIGNVPDVKFIWRSSAAEPVGNKLERVSCAEFGTRHTSMVRYCNADPSAVGIVISQDGDVRVFTRRGRGVVMWENVRLLAYETDLKRIVEFRKKARALRRKRQRAASNGAMAGSV